MQHRERIALKKICAEIDLALKFVENVTSEEFLADEVKSVIEKLMNKMKVPEKISRAWKNGNVN